MYLHKIKCFFILGAETDTLRSGFSNFVPMNDNISSEESTEKLYNNNSDAEEEENSIPLKNLHPNHTP